jgi:hypothetical protein
MNITVNLSALFRLKCGQPIDKVCRQGAKVIDVVTAIGIPDNESFMIVLNGSEALLNDSLHEGDILSLMPVAGDHQNSV